LRPLARIGNVGTKRRSGKTFVCWSMALSRQSSATMQEFNERMRADARTRGGRQRAAKAIWVPMAMLAWRAK